VRSTLALLERPEIDFLSELPAEQASTFRAMVREVILATDVTTTIPAIKEFNAAVEACKAGSGAAPTPTQVLRMIIKAADISNPARPLTVYSRWIDGVMLEFFLQGDAERAAGLPISMNCDRESVSVSKCQVGFISFLVEPLYKALLGYAAGMQPLVAQLEANKQHFMQAS
jgi:cAMP-specific phosphodiesterase 4